MEDRLCLRKIAVVPGDGIGKEVIAEGISNHKGTYT